MLTYVVSETLSLAVRLEYGIHSVLRGCSFMLHFMPISSEPTNSDTESEIKIPMIKVRENSASLAPAKKGQRMIQKG